MANELQELLNEIRDPRLKERLSAAIGELRKTKQFGLVFEEHLPEVLPIYSAKVRSHSRVARKDGRLTETLIVERVAKGLATVKPEQGEGESQNIPVSELVVVKRFGEAIFPALRHVESLLHGGDAPHHALIEADNYHALQLLEWLYAGKVDCIYIDPPYNKGNKDWKYNNNYVDENDLWRHSKWLSMLQRRLQIAKRLLNPTGTLIVAIDDLECAQLRLLLSQEFKEYDLTPVVIVHNPRGNITNNFSVIHEYALFLTPKGVSVISRVPKENERPRKMRRWGHNSKREQRRSMFYPVYVRDNKVIGIGEMPKDDYHPKARNTKGPNGSIAVWPIDQHGIERRWNFSVATFPSEMHRMVVMDTESGVDVFLAAEMTVPRSVQIAPELDAGGAFGTSLVESIVGTAFPYPKSLYTEFRCLQFAVSERPDALILDFFVGSGTTLNATLLLNEIDGGRRRCIAVTNNEVFPEQKVRQLKAAGYEEGHPEFEKHGICQSITFPRCKFVINGRREDGTELSGEYLTGRFQEQEVRRAVRPLDFATPKALASKRAREALAVAVGFTKSKVTGDESFLLSDGEHVAVLLEPDRLDEFIEQGEEWAESVETVYLPFPSGKEFNVAKEKIAEAWPPLTKSIEIKRPMKDGFGASLDYFRLDFLDRAQVETGGKLADILPALWMMAGCRGKLPTCKGSEKMLFFKDCPFAMLVEESAIKLFLAKLEERTDIDWVFLVTNDQDSFARMCEWLPEHIPASQRIHLWRNYVDNFLINVHRVVGEAP